MSDAITKKDSWITQFVHRAMQGVDKAQPKSALTHVAHAGAVTASYMQGGALGALLGATHAKFGLDSMGFPLDGAMAGVGAIASVALLTVAPQWSAWALRRGEDAFAIFTFRKGYELVHGSELPSGSERVTRIAKPGTRATPREDPIEAVARGLE